MTQQQLDQRILAGDTNVIPVGDLTRDQAAHHVSRLVTKAIMDGRITLAKGLDVAAGLMDAYDEYQTRRS